MSWETRRGAQPTDIESYAPITAWAFGGRVEDSLRWMSNAGVENLQLRYDKGRLVGGLLEIPMGQWFGGKSVPMLGIAGVAVVPEARRQGHALALVRQSLHEARERGVAVSTLYPATFALYRKAGYEIAGSYCRTTARLDSFAAIRSNLEASAVMAEDTPDIEQLYRDVAAGRPGYLDRCTMIWRRVREPEDAVKAFVVRGAHGLEAYAYFSHFREGGATDHDLLLRGGLIARSRAGFDRVLSLLASHRSVAQRAFWYGAPHDARLFILPERGFRVETEAHWMLRLVDVDAALAARGYPPLDASFDLNVDDPFLPQNSGRRRLQLHAGKAAVEPGAGDGAVALSINALGPLYSGFVSASELARAGLLKAPPRDLALLDVAFCSAPAPGLCDYF
jgi:predicted acetyltransferase